MENTKIPTITDTTPTLQQTTPPVQSFTHDELIDALYFAWDGFDRSNMKWFLVGETAKRAKMQRDLTGDGVDIGVRANEWRGGAERVFTTVMPDPLEESDSLVLYEHNGVPIRLHIYEPDDECIVATDSIMYRNEQFALPNPLERFEELYG